MAVIDEKRHMKFLYRVWKKLVEQRYKLDRPSAMLITFPIMLQVSPPPHSKRITSIVYVTILHCNSISGLIPASTVFVNTQFELQLLWRWMTYLTDTRIFFNLYHRRHDRLTSCTCITTCLVGSRLQFTID